MEEIVKYDCALAVIGMLCSASAFADDQSTLESSTHVSLACTDAERDLHSYAQVARGHASPSDLTGVRHGISVRVDRVDRLCPPDVKKRVHAATWHHYRVIQSRLASE
jgi:hypothetical protein